MSSEPSKKTTDQSSSKNPLAAQQPIYSSIWNKTGQAVDDFSPFTGNVVAGATAPQWSGAQGIVDANVGTNATDTAAMAKKIASGYFLDPTNDPTFQGAVNSAIAPVTRQLQEKVLPGITDRSIRAGGVGGGPGAYGGASQDIQENQAVHDWSKTAGDITSTMANASRNAGMSLINLIPGLNTSANAEALAGPQADVAGGSLMQSFNQSDLDNELQKYQLNQNSTLPFLQQAAQILGMGGFGDTTGKTVETGSAPSVAAQWLQGLTGGAGVANSLFGAAKGGTSAATGIMSMLSLLSDRRAKEDIEAIGKTFDDQTIYRYRYKGSPVVHIGLIAQEVLERTPEAITEIDELLHVNYDLATKFAAEIGRGEYDDGDDQRAA